MAVKIKKINRSPLPGEIKWLIGYEFKRELRQKYAISGILLYTVAAVFVVYLAVRLNEKPAWNGVYWVILLFSGVSALAKSFLQESRGRMIYYHQLVHPASYLLAKMAYNALYMIALNLVCFLFYSLWMGNAAEDTTLFMISTCLGCSGFSAVLTMGSALSSKTGNGHLLMPVISIPLLIPLLLVAVSASKKAADGLQAFIIYKDFWILLAFLFFIGVLGYILFPWLWKE